MEHITVRTKKEFEAVKKQFREKGYVFVTFGNKLAEMETIDKKHFVVIERVKP